VVVNHITNLVVVFSRLDFLQLGAAPQTPLLKQIEKMRLKLLRVANER